MKKQYDTHTLFFDRLSTLRHERELVTGSRCIVAYQAHLSTSIEASPYQGSLRTGFRRADKFDKLAFSAGGFRDAVPAAGLDLLVCVRHVA